MEGSLEGRAVPEGLVSALMTRFSTSQGYSSLYGDIFSDIRKLRESPDYRRQMCWPWERTLACVITNSDHRVPGILRSFGLNVGRSDEGIGDILGHVGDLDILFVVLSYDVGYEKPHRMMFDAAKREMLRLLRYPKAKEFFQCGSLDDFDLLHVGDNIKQDAKGAIAAGWDAILFDSRPDLKTARSVECDVEIAGPGGIKSLRQYKLPVITKLDLFSLREATSS